MPSAADATHASRPVKASDAPTSRASTRVTEAEAPCATHRPREHHDGRERRKERHEGDEIGQERRDEADRDIARA